MSVGVKIFSGRASVDLANKVAASYGMALGNVITTEFSDGEFQVSFEETVRGQDVFIVQSTFPPVDNLFELLLMVDAAKRASARKIIVVVPYFGFARQQVTFANLACKPSVPRPTQSPKLASRQHSTSPRQMPQALQGNLTKCASKRERVHGSHRCQQRGER